MSELAHQLLATFETLPAEDQHELVAQILRRTGELPDTVLTDSEMTAIADQLFQTLDLEEADGESNAR